jgi:hypothetical protein
MAAATEVIRRSMSTLAGLFTKKLPAGIWQFTFDEVGKGMKYAVNGRRYEFLAINGVMGITIDATNEKQLWYVISDDCTVQIEEVGQSANPFFSLPFLTGEWTPIDASTASLSLGSVSGSYSLIGNICFASFSVNYPSTADTTAAKIGGLPFLSSDDSNKWGGFITYSNYVTNVLNFLVSASNTILNIYINNASTVTNANLSTKIVRGVAIYKIA